MPSDCVPINLSCLVHPKGQTRKRREGGGGRREEEGYCAKSAVNMVLDTLKNKLQS
jgi:hypothetical protein